MQNGEQLRNGDYKPFVRGNIERSSVCVYVCVCVCVFAHDRKGDRQTESDARNNWCPF